MQKTSEKVVFSRIKRPLPRGRFFRKGKHSPSRRSRAEKEGGRPQDFFLKKVRAPRRKKTTREIIPRMKPFSQKP